MAESFNKDSYEEGKNNPRHAKKNNKTKGGKNNPRLQQQAAQDAVNTTNPVDSADAEDSFLNNQSITNHTNSAYSSDRTSHTDYGDYSDNSDYGYRSDFDSDLDSASNRDYDFDADFDSDNADSAYSRDTYDQESEKMQKRKKHKRRRRVLIVCLIVVLALIVAAAVAAFAYINYIQDRLQAGTDQELLASLETSKPGEPFYMLLLGTDGSADRDASEEYAGTSYRSDSIMLLRIDPQEVKVTAVSLHRDILVNLGSYGMQKLNAAYAFGGPSYAVQVVSKIAGVPISHYAEIDFDGFRDVVNALGGIEVDVPVEIDDDEAGGYLAAGPQTINGDQALILCRSRHTYDELGDGDQYRAANQRMVIAAIVKKILNTDIASMINTIQVLAEYVTTDMSVYEILSLAYNMRGINMDTDFYSGITPTESEYIGDGWYEILDETAWKKMMERVEQGLPPTEEEEVDPVTGIVLSSTGEGSLGEMIDETQVVEPEVVVPEVVRSGTVAIRNGTDIDGAAAAAAEIVAALGYTVDTGNANGSDYPQSLVVYETEDQAQYAREIADSLGISAVIQNNDEYLFDTNFLVVIGDDWSS